MDGVIARRAGAILAAGGLGARFGAATPKQFLDIDGRPMLERSLALLATHPGIREVVVALPAAHLDDVPDYLTRAWPCPVHVVAGGARRQDSVANAFAALDPAIEVVLIHDAARPFASAALVTRMLTAADGSGAAIPALPVTDTVKRACADGPRYVAETLPREAVYLAQTPQAFSRAVLSAALAAGQSAEDATDEAGLVERMGGRVLLVEGEPSNVKVTTPDDLTRARAGATTAAAAAPFRIGTGYDLHRLVPGRRLMLAGVHVPGELGLDGHSDADIVCHAVTDAILGAAALGDIGRLFPDTEAAWKDADSIGLLRVALARVHEAGFHVGNVDVTVIAERPKLQPHVPAMCASLAAALGVDVSAVSIKGKTNEKVDSMGRGESMACHAVALLVAAGSRPADGRRDGQHPTDGRAPRSEPRP